MSRIIPSLGQVMKAYPLIGESSGIMGRNKSGRSTLSEIPARVIYADSRSVIVKDGAAFPKLGAGVPVEESGLQRSRGTLWSPQ
jgi:ABC-type polysaccharide/polyol phosphate transport system ATPase subunit